MECQSSGVVISAHNANSANSTRYKLNFPSFFVVSLESTMDKQEFVAYLKQVAKVGIKDKDKSFLPDQMLSKAANEAGDPCWVEELEEVLPFPHNLLARMSSTSTTTGSRGDDGSSRGGRRRAHPTIEEASSSTWGDSRRRGTGACPYHSRKRRSERGARSEKRSLSKKSAG